MLFRCQFLLFRSQLSVLRSPFSIIMVTSYYFLNNEIRKLFLKELALVLQGTEGVLGVDLDAPNEAEEETVLVSLFDFHPLAIEDCQSGDGEEGHLPKSGRFRGLSFRYLQSRGESQLGGEPQRRPGNRDQKIADERISVQTCSCDAPLQVAAVHPIRPTASGKKSQRAWSRSGFSLPYCH